MPTSQVFYADETQPGYNYCNNCFIFAFKIEAGQKNQKTKKTNKQKKTHPQRIICFKEKKKRKKEKEKIPHQIPDPKG